MSSKRIPHQERFSLLVELKNYSASEPVFLDAIFTTS